MTDGIIQKTIYDFVKSLGYDNPKNQIMFMKLQNKLIEKIKQEITIEFMASNVGHYLVAKHLTEDIREKLIGDNQE